MCFVFLFCFLFLFFFFNDTATTEIYTLSLHDALRSGWIWIAEPSTRTGMKAWIPRRSEEHTSELQSHSDLVCRLLLEKKKKQHNKKHKKKKKTKKKTTKNTKKKK